MKLYKINVEIDVLAYDEDDFLDKTLSHIKSLLSKFPIHSLEYKLIKELSNEEMKAAIYMKPEEEKMTQKEIEDAKIAMEWFIFKAIEAYEPVQSLIKSLNDKGMTYTMLEPVKISIINKKETK